MKLSVEAKTVLEEQPQEQLETLQIKDIACLIASRRMRGYRHGWLMKWFASRNPLRAEVFMQKLILLRLKLINLKSIKLEVSKRRRRPFLRIVSSLSVVQVRSAVKQSSATHTRLEEEILTFLIANRDQPYTREAVIQALARSRLEALLNSECSEYVGDPVRWLEREERTLSIQMEGILFC